MNYLKNYCNDNLTFKSNVKYFKDTYPFDKRKFEASRIRKKYINRVPVIVERSNDNSIPLLEKKKYLVPYDLTIGEFMLLIRRKINLDEKVGIYLFFNDNILVTCSEMMGDSYNKHKDLDGFLYIKYSGENTFG